IAALHRRPAVGSADPGHDQHSPGVHRGLSRRRPPVLSPGRRKLRKDRRAVALQQLTSIALYPKAASTTGGFLYFCMIQNVLPRHGEMACCFSATPKRSEGSI